MKPVVLRVTQLVLCALILGLSLSVVGTASHTLNEYDSQHLNNAWWLPLWSEHFDTSGTRALVGCAATIFILNAAYLVALFVPKLNLNGRPTVRAALALAISLPSALLALASVVYAHILNRNEPENDTIQTWTCRYSWGFPPDMPYPIASEQSNRGFQQLCTESKFALYGTLAIFFLQALVLGFAVIGWLMDIWANRKSGKKSPDASSLEMNGVN